jgi:ATP-dependent helicase Lhr and Lhr-like helicase
MLSELREDRGDSVHPGGTVIGRRGVDLRWWTWAGYRANATLAATISDLADEKQSFDDFSIRLRTDLTREMWQAGTADVAQRLCLPEIDERALAGLKFSAALPHHLAVSTLAGRLADLESATRVLTEPARYTVVNT